MNNNNPYYGYPYYGYPQQNPNQEPAQQQEQPYKQQNSKTHFAMGVAAGAAVAYLLTNKKVKQGVAATGERAWSAVRGEVEELKERLEDTQAELEYYRNLHKGEE
ncbi:MULTISPECIES: YtxH domain-containing protein [Vibrio]|uniref:YtxH domain-containing protein n=1 Tax=Vibrio TaxID=662 RepID=UPI00148CD172|nr:MULTISPECIES: YtxH domain-containing protein [Vibrio]NOH30965.1 YtxH domain-containing protein [Vibrio mediterranei]